MLAACQYATLGKVGKIMAEFRRVRDEIKAHIELFIASGPAGG